MEIGHPVPEKKIFEMYGRGGHLGHVTQIPRTNFCQGGFTSNLALTGPAVSEKMFEHCERRKDARQWVYYKLTYEPFAQAFGSGELKLNLGFTGVDINFLIAALKHRLWVLVIPTINVLS